MKAIHWPGRSLGPFPRVRISPLAWCAGVFVLFLVGVSMIVLDEAPKSRDRPQAVVSIIGKPRGPSIVADMASVAARVRQARQERLDIVNATETQIKSDLAELVNSVDASLFADAELSWESTSQWVQGRTQHRCWVESKFSELVTTPDDARTIILARLQAMQQAIEAVNATLLNGEGLRPDYVPYPLEFDVYPLWLTCSDAIDAAQSASDFAPVEAVGNFAFSTLVGMATESLFRGLGPTDANGNPTATNQNTATAAGFGAGLASDALATELVGSKRSLKQSVESIIRSAFASMQSGGKFSCLWELPMFECAQYERNVAEEAIIRKYGKPLSDALATTESR